ncbi:MAG TPA: hypothetical protein VFV87_23250 [Pirellulaceae bacterium]|nr:hypothetical protein [Pirellulaceae bacterium]
MIVCYRQFACLLLLSSMLSAAAAEEPADSSSAEQALRTRWQEVYGEIAASIEMSDGRSPLRLHDNPLLSYSNPVRSTDQHGSIFLWTDRGRPAVFGSIWSAENRTDHSLRNITHEFHSLSTSQNVQAIRDGRVQWSAGEPGIEWQTLADAPAPATTRSARLVQMRDLARRLTAKITAPEETELRLMPRPLYRYPEDTAGAMDGALLVFVLATDPELILLIEADDSDKPVYRTAIARFGNVSMSVAYGDRQIWSCDRGTPGRSEGKYYLHWRIDQRPANLTPAP